MLRLEGNRGVHSCDSLTRRDFLRVGGLAVGLRLTELAHLQQAGATSPSREKACIQLFLVGGPSQLDTWDLKPDAPDGVRGPFRPIRTNVPGITLCEHFPLMARRADHYAILRSVHHGEAPIHETGQQLLQTGSLFRGETEWPHCGAAMSRIRPASHSMPSWVVLPRPIGNTGVSVGHGQTGGFLGEEFDPHVPAQEMVRAELAVSDPNAPHGLDPARLNARNALVNAVDAAQRELETHPRRSGREDLSENAWSALFSSGAKKAFDLTDEPESVRARYGWNTFGQSCLLARRLMTPQTMLQFWPLSLLIM